MRFEFEDKNKPTYEKFSVDKFRTPGQKVFILLGVPGSGKSTVAQEIVNAFPDTEIISRDIERINLGIVPDGEKGVGNKEQENSVTLSCKDKMFKALEDGKNIIIDNTHAKRSYRQALRADIGNRRVQFIYIYCMASNIEKNYQRRPGDNWKQVIDRQVSSFEHPTRQETDVVYYKIS